METGRKVKWLKKEEEKDIDKWLSEPITPKEKIKLEEGSEKGWSVQPYQEEGHFLPPEVEEAEKKEKDKKDMENFSKVFKQAIVKSKEIQNEIIGQVSLLLLQKQPDDATELLAKFIITNHHIYTIRDDKYEEMWMYYDGIYIPEGKTYIKELCRIYFGKAIKTNFVNVVLLKIQTETYVDKKTFFEQKNLDEIAVENGILNIHTKELSDFTPTKFFFNKIPVIYAPKVDCPITKKHYSLVLKNGEEDAKVMQELFGYLLYTDYPIEKAIMLTGSGRNGKGKSLLQMKAFIGPENCTAIPVQQFDTDLYSLGELLNKRANLAGDISPKALTQTGNFKGLVGRDSFSAARKFKPRINFVNYAKMIFAANELPRTSDVSPAFFNRWILLEFPFTFISQKEINTLPENERKNVKLADPDIIDKLTTPEELSGVLNWALEGLKHLLHQGDFSYSQSVADVKDKWLRMSDSVAAFIMDEVVENWDASVLKSEMRKAYGTYCRNHKLKMVTEAKFKDTLTQTYAVSESRPSSGDRQWDGVELKHKDNNCSNDNSQKNLEVIYSNPGNPSNP